MGFFGNAGKITAKKNNGRGGFLGGGVSNKKSGAKVSFRVWAKIEDASPKKSRRKGK